MTSNQIWMAVGLVGQLLFMSRFVVQWISSEAERRSVIPVSFWYLSLAGSSLLLSYAIWRQDVVFMVGQGAGFVIYIRNLQLIANRVAAKTVEESGPSGEVASIAPPPSLEVRQARVA